MKTGPRGSPDIVPAAIRRLSRFPADSRRSRPNGTATSPFTCLRAAHSPPVMVTAPSGTGRSRQVASGVGATGPGTVSCLVAAGDAGVMAVVTIPPATVVEERARRRPRRSRGRRGATTGRAAPTGHVAPHAGEPVCLQDRGGQLHTLVKGVSDLPHARTVCEQRQGQTSWYR